MSHTHKPEKRQKHIRIKDTTATAHVSPVIFTPNDVARDRTWEREVVISFEMVRDYYLDKVGKTFQIYPFVVIPKGNIGTQAEFLAISGDFPKWQACMQLCHDQGFLDVNDPTHAYYLITREEWNTGGMVGAENWGAPFIYPGRACSTGHMGRLTGNVIDPGWPEWFADERREAAGSLAHELGHVFAGLPHPGVSSIMENWWDFPTVGFTQTELDTLAASAVTQFFLE